MRAISLWQPWASLCFEAWPDATVPIKLHETRGWPLPDWMVGERVIIHAAKTKRGMGCEMDRTLHDLCGDAFGCGYNYSLPFGAAIGTARLLHSRSMSECQPANDSDEIAGDWSDGRYAWRLGDARAFKEPVPMVGRQKFWTPTEDVRAAIHSQDPALGEDHFHVCGACFHLWMHAAKANASHRCPKCDAGPFTEGWGSRRSAHEAMVALKAQRTASANDKVS